MRHVLILLLVTLPLTCIAGPFKCTAPDRKITFQDQPCQAGAAGSQINIKVTPANPAAATKATADKMGADRGQRRSYKLNELNKQLAEADARNRNVLCNTARHNLGLLNEQGRIYTYNNKGKREYIDDAARESKIVAAKRYVAESCN